MNTELRDLTESEMKLSTKYATERNKYGKAKADLDIILAGQIIEFQSKVKNMGMERALITLMAVKPEVQPLYREMIEAENNYKALEKMIDSTKTRIMALMSLMKWTKENDSGY